MKRMFMVCLFALMAVFAAAPVSAVTVVDTFTGHIVAMDSYGGLTTNDFNGNFGGGNLIGQAFTLVMTTTVDPGTTYATGSVSYGSYYYPPNPITAALTINGYTFTINESSDGFTSDLGSGTIDKYLQAFVWNSGFQLQMYGIVVDLSTLVAATNSLDTALPSMLLSNGDFITNYAAFYDQSMLRYTGQVETLNLGIEEVNVAAQVPEPATLFLLGVGLVGAGFIRRRKG